MTQKHLLFVLRPYHNVIEGWSEDRHADGDIPDMPCCNEREAEETFFIELH